MKLILQFGLVCGQGITDYYDNPYPDTYDYYPDDYYNLNESYYGDQYGEYDPYAAEYDPNYYSIYDEPESVPTVLESVPTVLVGFENHVLLKLTNLSVKLSVKFKTTGSYNIAIFL